MTFQSCWCCDTDAYQQTCVPMFLHESHTQHCRPPHCPDTQVRECATALLHVAKQEKIPIFLIGHVTKVCCCPPCAVAA
jgi:hypothetical protein